MADNRTLKLSVAEGAVYTLAFNATQGFVYSTLAMYYNFDPVLLSVVAVLPSTAQIIQFFAPLVYKFIPSKHKAIYLFAFIARTSFILIPIAMLLNLKNKLIIAIPFFIFGILNSIVGSLWTSAMKNIVSEERRSSYFGFRNTIATFAGLIAWVFYSIVLQYLPRRVGLLIVYSVSSVLFIVTVYLLKLHNIPETKVVEYGLLMPFKSLKNRRFRKFLVFVFVWNFAIQFAGPFFSYFEVSQIKVPYSFLGIVNVINSIFSMFLYSLYGKVAPKLGEKNMIKFGIILALGIPIIYSFMNPINYTWLLVIGVIISAVAWSAINLCYFTLLLKISDEPSEIYISMHAFVAGIASLIASYAGGLVMNALKDVSISIFTGYNILFMIAFILRFG
ncbi:MAG TPA: MFS transporter, partial [Fervidobacterium sp.]|nr:MFS transporter [Fervidobacterium sp.]